MMHWRWVVAALLVCFTSVVSAAEPIVIGQSLPLQGADTDGRGEQVLAGAQALVESVNARGGIGGRVLKLVTLNNQGDLELHRQNLRTLARQHKAVAWINCLGDAQCRMATAEARAQRIALVGVHAGLSELRRSNEPRMFRIRPNYAREAEAMARQLGALGVRHVALVCSVALDAVAEEPLLAVQTALAQASIASTVMRMGNGAGADRTLLRQLATGRHAAAVVLLDSGDIVRLVEAGLDGSLDWPSTLFSLANGTLNLMWGNFPHSVIGHTSVVPNPDRGTLALTRELQQAAERTVGPLATTAAGLEAYVSAKIVAEALRKTVPSADSEAVYKALDSLGELDLGGLRVNMASTRNSASDFIDISLRPKIRAR